MDNFRVLSKKYLILASKMLTMLCLISVTFVFPALSKPMCEGIFLDESALRTQKLRKESPAPYSLSILLEKVKAVHVTQFIASDNVIRPTSEISDVANFRPGSHFALGQMVKSHGNGSWEEMPYAYILPLKAIESQVLNLMPHDTFVLGSVRLPPDAVLLMPHNDPAPNPVGIKVIRYEGKLRHAVDKVIIESRGFSFTSDIGAAAISHKAFSMGRNTNSRDFFAPFFEAHPQVSYQAHGSTRWGVLDTWLSGKLKSQFQKGEPYKVTTEVLQFERDVIEMNLRALDQLVPTYSPEAQAVYRKTRANFVEYLNIVDVDLILRKKYGKTALENPKAFSDMAFKLRRKKAKLLSYLESKKDELVEPISGIKTSSFPDGFGVQTWLMTLPEVLYLYKKYPNLLENQFGKPFESFDSFLRDFLKDRIATISPAQAEAEGLIEKRFTYNIQKIKESKDEVSMALAIKDLKLAVRTDYQIHGWRQDADLEIFAKVLTIPEVKESIEHFFKVEDLVQDPNRPLSLEFGEAKGRNGAWYGEATRGFSKEQWYIKGDEKFPESQTSAEVITSSIYKFLGYEVPYTSIVYINGKRYSASEKLRYEDSELSKTLALAQTPEMRRLRVFAAFLKDWDRVQGGNNNFYRSSSRRFALLDFGGSLGIRSQGEHKPGQIFSNAIGSFEATKDLNMLFDSFNPRLDPDHSWNKLTVDDYREATQMLKNLTDFDINQIVDRAKYSNQRDADYMKYALKTRRDGMVEGLSMRFGF